VRARSRGRFQQASVRWHRQRDRGEGVREGANKQVGDGTGTGAMVRACNQALSHCITCKIVPRDRGWECDKCNQQSVPACGLLQHVVQAPRASLPSHRSTGGGWYDHLLASVRDNGSVMGSLAISGLKAVLLISRHTSMEPSAHLEARGALQ
jgi:hypothetical protein